MRGFSIIAVAVLGLGVAACGQNRNQAADDLAAKEEAAVPKPAEPGQTFVGEVTPEPLQDYAVPAEGATEEMPAEDAPVE
jgi:hypothetical protein